MKPLTSPFVGKSQGFKMVESISFRRDSSWRIFVLTSLVAIFNPMIGPVINEGALECAL